MSKPAATIGHFHVCPKKTGNTPHVGGPVAAGAPNVFINGVPAARVGDRLICNGPPDSIKQGSATVFINGKPAARQGDGTSHGGVVIGGSGNVFIGDQSYVVPPGPTPVLTEFQAMTLRKPAPFCEECEKCKEGHCEL
ncbi:PAAR domain-containing protein [Pokkaliibacter sp. CJK22405]|uniref:PAAR domain-containing protein n=1 Tax=Pokkaliibacter sp. CJK22405 TaxID=3384615 RepID=UPI0039847F42